VMNVSKASTSCPAFVLGIEVSLSCEAGNQLPPPGAHAPMRNQESIAPDAFAVVRPPPQRGLSHVVVVARDVGHG
jgi:hypothetical protein